MSENLSDFFKLLAEDKKNKKEEFDSVVGDLGLDSLFGEFAALKKKEKEKKVQLLQRKDVQRRKKKKNQKERKVVQRKKKRRQK